MTRKELFLTQLTRRTERLKRLIEVNAPEWCLCNEAFLIFRAAMGLNPEATGKAMGEHMGRMERLYSGFCAHGEDNCENRVVEGYADVLDFSTCSQCKEKIEHEGAEMDKEFGDIDTLKHKD
jgi:hypothetical protein